MALRYGNSEFITKDVIDEVKENQNLAEEKNLKEDKNDKTQKLQELTNLVYQIDPMEKALTGRTPTRIEEETGISADEIFPMNTKILYVGDPWQRMGKELDESHGSNFTLIDYEFGEVASFVRDDDFFRARIEAKGWSCIETFQQLIESNSYSEKEIAW